MANNSAIEKRPEHEIRRGEQPSNQWTYVPRCDILDLPDELLVLADMPGVNADGLDIQYRNETLRIHGRVEPRREAGPAQYRQREYGVGDFYRSFRVPGIIDVDKISAEIRNGVMQLHLPKTEAYKARKIPVKAS